MFGWTKQSSAQGFTSSANFTKTYHDTYHLGDTQMSAMQAGKWQSAYQIAPPVHGEEQIKVSSGGDL